MNETSDISFNAVTDVRQTERRETAQAIEEWTFEIEQPDDVPFHIPRD